MGKARSSRSGRTVKIKRHTRSPRGPDRGKPRVSVPAYSRSRPHKKS